MRVAKCIKQKFTEIKGEIEKPKIIVGDSTPLGQKLLETIEKIMSAKDLKELNNIIDQ